MNLVRIIIFLVVLVLVAACTQTQQTPELEPQVTKTYQVNYDNFANPERGFFYQRTAWDPNKTSSVPMLSTEDMRQARREGYSLLRVYYVIDSFRNSALSRALLDTFTQNLNTARQEGVKLIPLFTYTFPTDSDWANGSKYPDAPLDRVLQHIRQLKPIIQQNSDVIAMWDAGFLGPWGEWHHSSNGHFDNIDDINSNSRRVMNKLLEVVPSNRAITIRYVRQKFALYGTTPITASQAFRGSAKARVGHKNDCYLTSADDWTGYAPDVEGQKNFLNQDNLFVPQQ